MILVAVGANLPGPGGRPPLESCRWAVAEVGRIEGLRLDGVSRWYRSTPVPASDQPDYVNGVIRLSGMADPARLLAQLHEIERLAGRARGPAPGQANAARTLDLDIIDMDGIRRDTADPVLPHPRAALRAFVLLPLADVAPDWIEPRSGCCVAGLIAALPPDDGHGCGNAVWPL